MPLTEYPITALEDTHDQVKKLRSGVGLVLNQEGLVNDLSYHVNRHRRDMDYGVSDRITLELAVSPEVWWAIHFNESELKRKTLTKHIRFLPAGALVDPSLTEVELGEKDNLFKVYLKSYQS